MHTIRHMLYLVISWVHSNLMSDITHHDPGLWPFGSPVKPCTVKSGECLLSDQLESINIEAFKADLVSCPHLASPPVGLHDLVSTYSSDLLSILDNHAPARRSTSSLRPDCKWFNSELFTTKMHMHALERKRTRSGLTVMHKCFTMMQREYRRSTHEGEQDYYTNYIIESPGIQDILFSIID